MKKQLLMLGLAVGSVFSTKAQSADIQWAKGFGATGSGSDNASSIAVDDAGNTYAAGLFTGTTDFDPGPGQFSLTSTGERDIYIQKLDANGDFVWAAGFQSSESKFANEITVDPSGNVILVGRFRGTIDFDPGPGTANRTAAGLSGIPGTNDDAFIVKLDANGNYLWATSMGQFSTDVASYVTTDAVGNIYTTGTYRNNVDFNPGSGTNVLTNNGGANIFIQKLSPNGNYIWARGYGGTNTDNGRAVAVDDNQNVYLVASISSDNWAFDSNNLANSSHSVQGNGFDVVVLKLNQAGNFQWSRQVGGNSSDDVYGIALDNLGKPVITGAFSGSADFDPSFSGVFTLNTSGSTDSYTLKLDANGDFEWATKMGGTSDDLGRRITTDAAGSSYTTGYFRGTADFDPGSGTDNRTSAGNREIFVQKLDTDGNYVWAKTIGGTGDDYGLSLDHNAAGELVIAGFFSGTVDFEDGSGVTNLISAGTTDAYVVKYFECVPETATDVITACGSYEWINGTTYTSSNNSAQVTLTNQAGCDSVVTLDLTINQSDATTDVITACSSYEWINGTTYTSSNNSAQVTLTNQAGCDSVVTLDLTINQSDATTDVISACGSYEWINGMTYTASNNSAQVTLTNLAGCDSVVTLDLTINQSDATTDVITACDSYEWINGTTYTASNNSAQVTLTNQAGCDSVVTLDLTINQSDATTDVISACGSYEWINGTTYTSSNNSAQVTLTNQAGCDSVVTLDLTINQPDATTDVITACDSYEWINGTTYTASNNSAQVTLTNLAGCDSVVTLDLTINQSDATTDVITACDSYEWINGTTYTSSNNSAQVTLTNQAGCDSVVTLDLTINQPDATTDVITACGSYEWINGTTYTASNNSAQVTLTNLAGCDSVVTLDLTINQPDATTDVISACGSYEWINGTTYTASNNSAQVTLTNQAGCDSVVTLDLTINQPDATTDVITACDSYEWINGTTYTSSNNSAQVTLTNQAGCDSIVTLDLTINSVGITSVSSTGNTISASNSGATFQWVDCDDNFAPIAGETGSDFTPSSTGNYAVEVTNNGCTEISNCESVMITSLNDEPLNERVSIYPQPSNGDLNVNLGGLENVNISIYSSNGQLVHQSTNIQQSIYTMNLNEPAGLYVMMLEAENQTARFKIVLR